MKYAKEKLLTFLHFYRIIFLTSTVITGIIVLILDSPLRISLAIGLIFTTFGFIGSMLLNHYFNKRRYTFYRNQGLTIKSLYIMAFVSNLTISLFLNIILGTLWQI